MNKNNESSSFYATSVNSVDILKFLKEFEKEIVDEIPSWIGSAHKPIPEWVSKILFWVFLLMLPLAAVSGSLVRPVFVWKDVLLPLIPVLFCLIMFFFNQIILVPKFFFRKKVKTFIVLNFLLSVFLITLRNIVLFGMFGNPESYFYLFFSKSMNHPVLQAVMTIAIFFLVTFFVSVFNIVLRIVAIQAHFAYWMRVRENILLESDLLFLRQQLSPHFLFNTLNNITSLMDIDVKMAQKSMIQLSSLLRQILYETKEKNVSISNEVDLLNKYLALEKLRFSSNVECHFKFTLEDPNIRIAPLLMMPLVENAIKYGVHPVQPCSIEIIVEEKDSILFCRVKNFIVPRATSIQTKSGIGLGNLKRRLDVCYPNLYEYSHKEENGFYTACLNISLSEKKSSDLSDGAFGTTQNS